MAKWYVILNLQGMRIYDATYDVSCMQKMKQEQRARERQAELLFAARYVSADMRTVWIILQTGRRNSRSCSY